MDYSKLQISMHDSNDYLAWNQNYDEYKQKAQRSWIGITIIIQRKESIGQEEWLSKKFLKNHRIYYCLE